MERLKEENFSETPPGNHHDLPTDDVIQLYLEEIKDIPLLSRLNEQKLFKIKKEGEQAQRRLNENHDLPDQEKEDLAVLIQQGRKARGELINSNQRLVISIAKRYRGQGVPFPDLVQEGTTGLISAVDRFDLELGFKLSTYATWWIRQALTRAVASQGRTIRLPVHKYEKIKRLKRTGTRLTQELGREPTGEELANELGTEPGKIEDLQKIARREPVSLDKPIHPEERNGSDLFGDFVENGEAGKPGETASGHALREKIENLLSNLTLREAAIIRWRNGLVDGHCYTLEEVGKKFGLSRERIRQIEQKALRKLRHPSRARKLRDFHPGE